MDVSLRKDADTIIASAIKAVLPDAAVTRALTEMHLSGRVIVVSAGKAAWQMARADSDCLGSVIEKGVVITK